MNPPHPLPETLPGQAPRSAGSEPEPQLVREEDGRQVTGAPRLGDVLAVRISPADAAALALGARASGIASVQVAWGDQNVTRSRHAKHVYLRPGLFRIKATVTDRAGNVTRLARFVRVLP